MKNKERIMAILDEIRSLSSDRITENLADALQMRVEWAYEYAENCNLPEVLLAIGSYNWYGGQYRGLKKDLIEKDVIVKIEKKIHNAEDLLVSDLAEILRTKCGCRSI
jgi:hypothetical protein